METLTPDQVRDLSVEELGRIQKTLVRRLRSVGDRNVIAVGFGAKRRKNRIRRGVLAARYLVRRKRMPRVKKHRILGRVVVRLKRPEGIVRVVLPTDVEEILDTAETGAHIPATSSTRLCTTGLIVRWLPTNSGNSNNVDSWKWGFLTVSHSFDGVPRPFFPQIQLPNGVTVVSKLHRKTRPAEKIDAAILLIEDRATLDGTGFVTTDPLPPAIPVRDSEQLRSDANTGAKGRSHRVSTDGFPYTPVHFQAADFHPDGFPIGGRKRKHILHVTQSQSGAFETGTSGSAWDVQQMPAAIQLGANPDFADGFGQCLSTIRAWALEKLNAAELLVMKLF